MAAHRERRSAHRPAANESQPTDSRFCCAPPERRQKWSLLVARSTDGLQMPDGQAGQQVLRFHADSFVGSHRQDQVDRLTFYLVEHIRWIAEIQAEQSNDACHGYIVDIVATPKHVTD